MVPFGDVDDDVGGVKVGEVLELLTDDPPALLNVDFTPIGAHS